MNHVFVDFENVRDVNLSVAGNKLVNFTLMLGPGDKKLDTDLVEEMMKNAAPVRLLRLVSRARDAADIALAFYLGLAVASDPTGYFHIVSKDTGFDPMIEHLRERKFHVRRHESFATLTFSMPVKPVTARTQDLYARVREHLTKNKNNRPKREKTLVTNLKTLVGASGSERDVQEIINRLRTEKLIAIDEKGAVSYKLEGQQLNSASEICRRHNNAKHCEGDMTIKRGGRECEPSGLLAGLFR